MKDRKIIITEDGSPSIYIPELDEGYHSMYGALNESNHVYIICGLSQIEKNEITIFEMGLGTGLNALLAFKYGLENGKKINYYSIEKYPISEKEVSALDYSYLYPEALEVFNKIHSSIPNETSRIGENFTIIKSIGDIKDFDFTFKHDVCFYDAFSPEIQPDLWTPEIFSKIYESLNDNGILSTYCVKGQIRRILKGVGFSVERLPGPIGKRVITQARKSRKP